ncbi:general secretion pathway protein GspK [Novilysobacter defluvii]|uniref:general secretion pathway protein GspK n=1 Tax=Novilysobacter defluvii TaxID=391738 RepID=UPI0026B9E4ED
MIGRPARGAALVLVLWLIVLLTAVVGGYVLTARTGGLQGRVELRQLQGDAAARAGIEYAMWRLNHPDPALRWHPDGRAYPWQYGEAAVEVRITDERGRVDLNHAPQPLLQALLEVLGTDPDRAAMLSARIVDWRDPDGVAGPDGAETPAYAAAGRRYGAKDAPFETVDELLQVLGVEPSDHQRLRPYVTVHSGLARPEAAFAALPVLEALQLPGAGELVELRARDDGGSDASLTASESVSPARRLLRIAEGGAYRRGTYSIDSLVRLPDGSRTRTRAVVTPRGTGVPGMGYMVLAWEEGASPQ